MTRYYSPVHLASIYHSLPNRCWRCNVGLGTLPHIWWDCSVIKPFSESVFAIYDCHGTTYVNYMKVALLSILPGSVQTIKHSALRFFLVVAQHVIPKHWKSPMPPTPIVMRHSSIFQMEQIVGRQLHRWNQFQEIWLSWILYKDTPKLQRNFIR